MIIIIVSESLISCSPFWVNHRRHQGEAEIRFNKQKIKCSYVTGEKCEAAGVIL